MYQVMVEYTDGSVEVHEDEFMTMDAARLEKRNLIEDTIPEVDDVWVVHSDSGERRA